MPWSIRHAKESEELTREAQQQANRSLQYFYDEDGSLVIKARLPAQTGTLLMKAIDKAAEDLWETEPEAVEADTPAGTPSVKFLPTRTKRADALELLAESFLQNGAATLSGGDIARTAVTRWGGGPMDFGMGDSQEIRFAYGWQLPAITAL